MTNIWTPNGNRVAALPPGPDDLFVVTTVEGQRVALQPIADYDKAIEAATAAAGQCKTPVKVLCMSVRELLCVMGYSPASFGSEMSRQVDEDLRQLAIAACLDALRECDQRGVREEAFEALKAFGVLKL